MSEKLSEDKEGDIFDDVESLESDRGKNNNMQKNFLDDKEILSLTNHQNQRLIALGVIPQEQLLLEKAALLELPPKSHTVTVMSHLGKKQSITMGEEVQVRKDQGIEIHENPLPIMQGAHSLAHDMKFGWKPEVAFEFAPIPLYFNFIEQALVRYYQNQSYYHNGNRNHQPNKIIYYGPRFKDSYEMHKMFVRPAESTYEFAFPNFFGIGSAKEFYDSFFADEYDGEKPAKEEMRDFTGMAPDVEWEELRFNSNFENGNLDMVVKTGENTYDLFLRPDTNTKGHFGWFHFEVSRTKKGRTCHFNIVNMSKPDSLHTHGMQINYWSQKRNQPRFVGWERGGKDIRYGPSRIVKESLKYRRKYYSLSFSFTFESDDDKIWFAYTIPYTYSMLTQYIKAIVGEQRNSLEDERVQKQRYEQMKMEEDFDPNHPDVPRPRRWRGRYLQDNVLCKSLGGVDVPILTITNFEDPEWQKKKIVFVQGRLHPSETSSSWVVHGLISFLVSKSRVANELRKRLVFKIIPMCNPDGVIIGNTRTTLIGRDMNRQFPQGQNQNNQKQKPKDEDSDGEGPQIEEAKLNPIPYAIRDLLHQILKMNGVDDQTKPQHQHLNSDKIQSFWDIHQHSNKKSIFIYGPYFPLHSDKYLKIRLIPKLLSERSEMFRFYSCKFFRTDFPRGGTINGGKETCARVTIGRQFNITNCFTLECSSYGYISKNSRATMQFKEADLIEFGKNLAESVLEYALVTERDAKVKQGIKDRINLRKSKTMRMVGWGMQSQKKEASSPNKQAESNNGDGRRFTRRKKSTEPLRYTGQADENGNAVVENASDSALLEEDDDSCFENDDGGGPPIIVISRDKRIAAQANQQALQRQGNEVMSSGSGNIIQQQPAAQTSQGQPGFDQTNQQIVDRKDLEESQSSSQEQEKKVKIIVQDLSNQINQQNVQKTGPSNYQFEPIIRYFSDEDFEDFEEDNITEEEEDKDYEMCPVTKPFELRGLLKIKQKRSELDLNFYRQNPMQQQVPGPQSINEEASDDEEERNQSTIEQQQMPLQLPSSFESPPIEPLQSKQPVVKRKMQIRNRTLEQILSMIQTDIIQEEQIENEESNTYVSPRNNKPDSDSDDEGNDEDFLDGHDMKILRARILHAIEMFSKWNPHYNNRKEMLRHRRALKLSIENRSRASSKPSQKNGSESSVNGESGGNRQVQQSQLSPRKGINQNTIKKNIQITSPQNSSKNVDKQQQMDIIDNFFKDFGIRGASGQAQQQLPLGFGPHSLALVGNRITSTKLSDLDDEVLSTISNEILRFNSSHKKKRKNILGTDDIIMAAAPGQGGNTTIFQSPFKAPSPQIQLSGHKNIINNLNNSSTWHTNQSKLIDQQLSNILSLKLDNRARKIILQKFISQNPTAALNIKIDQYIQQSQQSSPIQAKDKSPKHTNQSLILNAGPSISAPSVHEDFRDQFRIPFQNSTINQSRQQTQSPQVSNKILTLFGLRDRKNINNASDRGQQQTPQPKTTSVKNSHLVKKKNPHLMGFEGNLDTLNQFITDKKSRLMKKEVLSDFRIISNSVLGDGSRPRPQSSSNHYQIVKHQLARLYQNDGMIHAKKERPVGFLNEIKPELHYPIPPIIVKKEVELTNPSPILIQQAHLNSDPVEPTVHMKANAQTDIQKKESMQILSHTTSLNRVSLLLSRQNSLLIQDSQRSQCSKDHSHTKASISKSPNKRMNVLLMTAETKVNQNAAVVDSINSERRSILSSQAKQNQLKIDQIHEVKHDPNKTLEKVVIPSIEQPVLRIRQQKAIKEVNKKHSLLLNSSIDDMSHQISLYQWNKHIRHAKENQKMLIVKNQDENRLNLAATQKTSSYHRSYTKSVTPQETQFESPNHHLFEITTKSSTIKSQIRKSLAFKKKDNESLATRASIETTKKKLVEEFQLHNQSLNQDLIVPTPEKAVKEKVILRAQTATNAKLATHLRRKTAQSPMLPQQKAYLEYVQAHKSEIVKEIVIRAGEQKILEVCQKQ